MTPAPDDPPRTFIVKPDGNIIRTVVAPMSDIEATSVFADSMAQMGYTPQQVASLLDAVDVIGTRSGPRDHELLLGCIRTGRDPVAFAKHLMHLRDALR